MSSLAQACPDFLPPLPPSQECPHRLLARSPVHLPVTLGVLNVGLWTGNTSIPWKLLRNANCPAPSWTC